jgi:hypothetical protein
MAKADTTPVAVSPAPAQVAPATPQPGPNDLVSIYNRSPKFGDFVHDTYVDVKDSDGRTVARKVGNTYRAPAGAFTKVPRWIAELWKKQAPRWIVDSESVGAPSGHSSATAEVVELRQKNADMDARMKNMEKLIADLQGGRA